MINASVFEPTMVGWVRVCTACGAPDIHAVYSSASMLDRPSWTCSSCGGGRHCALHLPLDVSSCPALRRPEGVR